ncbi:hypothetical protein MKW94_030948 [Papaver nudicaule]|uniref:Cysteine-rich transmembrane CYSTM domain-containing protein n=1 Tax=Papaver nudicaule TaxID=74823 RepID=A0AA41VR50_PAPNU|nr:hypothetical protein [Papaver nudicaule]
MAQAAYPPPQSYPPAPAVEGYPPPGVSYAAPPPAGYPEYAGQQQSQAPGATTDRGGDKGDGFWKGCCAALCCCCVFDACF